MKIETRKGIWVSSSFTERFGVPEVTSSETVPSFKTLERYLTDSEVKNELGAGESTLGDVVAFLENPPNGTDDGYWNSFYVAGYVVNVYWSGGYREWYVYAWEPVDGNWNAGSRVFSCNWHSDPKMDSLSLSPSEPLPCGHTCITCVIKKENV